MVNLPFSGSVFSKALDNEKVSCVMDEPKTFTVFSEVSYWYVFFDKDFLNIFQFVSNSFCLCISYCLGKDREYFSTEIRALVSLQRELS